MENHELNYNIFFFVIFVGLCGYVKAIENKKNQ